MAKVWHGEGSNMYIEVGEVGEGKVGEFGGGLKRLEVGEVGMTTDLQSNK